jgi:hypothetical protein
LDEPFSRMQNPARRAERYRKVAEEYVELARDAPSPFLRTYYQRVAQDYRTRADEELRIVEQDGAATRSDRRLEHRAGAEGQAPAHRGGGDGGCGPRAA